MSDLKEFLEDIDIDKIKLSIGIAVDLIAAGNEILEFLKTDSEVDEIELIELIEKHNTAKEAARQNLIESIKKRKALQQ